MHNHPREKPSGANRKNRKSVLSILFAVLLIAMCLLPGNPDPARSAHRPVLDNTLRFDVFNGFRTFNPVSSNGTGATFVLPLVHSHLACPMDDEGLQGDLAKSWRYDPDRFLWQIEIRENAVFHDGLPVTAADVAFTLDGLLYKSRPGVYEQIEKVSVPSKFRVNIALKIDDPEFFTRIMGMEILPSHLPMDSHDRHPVGCGPFRFVKSIDGKKVVLEAFDGFYNGRPAIDRVEFYFIPDKEKSWARLLNGETDIAPLISPRNFEMLSHLKTDYRISENLSHTCWSLLLNTHDPRLNDPRVRRALALGIDRTHIVETILMGHGQVTDYQFGDATDAGKPKAPSPAYNPVKGRALLESAGWKRNEADGLYYRDGSPFEITILYPLENPVEKQVARSIKLSLYDLGVKVLLSPVALDRLIASTYFNNDFQAALVEIIPLSYSPLQYIGAFVPGEDRCARLGCFNDEKLSNLYRETLGETDPYKRDRKTNELISLFSDLQPSIELFHKADIDLISKRVQTRRPRMSSLFDIHRLYEASLRN